MASAFPSVAGLSAIIQQSTLNRKGLVADCIFPPVKTPCFFQYIDWTNGQNIQLVEDAVTCKSDVKEIDPEAWTLVQKKVADHALVQSMGDCCVTVCGDAGYAAKKEQGKTIQLLNRMLIARERRAIALATDLANYTTNSALVPGAVGAVNEGYYYTISVANFNNQAYNLLGYFLPIQSNNYLTGRRTVAVMSRNKLNTLMMNTSMIGGGCAPGAITSEDVIASRLGVDKICVADAGYNSSVGPSVSLGGMWPDNIIWFGASYELLTAEDPQVAFGISAYDKGFGVYHYNDPKKGPGAGVEMQKQSHDFTEIVLSYKAATIVYVNG